MGIAESIRRADLDAYAALAALCEIEMISSQDPPLHSFPFLSHYGYTVGWTILIAHHTDDAPVGTGFRVPDKFGMASEIGGDVDLFPWVLHGYDRLEQSPEGYAETDQETFCA